MFSARGYWSVLPRPHPQRSAMCYGDTSFFAGGCFQVSPRPHPHRSAMWYCLIFAGGCCHVSTRPHPQLSAMCCGDTLFIAGGCFYAMFFRRRLFSSFAPTRPLAQRNVLCFCLIFARGNWSVLPRTHNQLAQCAVVYIVFHKGLFLHFAPTQT